MTAILVRGRDDVLTVMRKQRETTGLTHLEMDELVGLGSGHYGKLERMGAAWGKQGLRMSSSVMNSLDALGLEIVIAPKGEVLAEAIPRDVRLVPEAQVAPPPPPTARQAPGWFEAWAILRAEANRPRQKKTRRTGVQRVRERAMA